MIYFANATKKKRRRSSVSESTRPPRRHYSSHLGTISPCANVRDYKFDPEDFDDINDAALDTYSPSDMDSLPLTFHSHKATNITTVDDHNVKSRDNPNYMHNVRLSRQQSKHLTRKKQL